MSKTDWSKTLFAACDACAAKPELSLFCAGCQANRKAIETLRQQLREVEQLEIAREAEKPRKPMTDVQFRESMQGLVDAWNEQMGRSYNARREASELVQLLARPEFRGLWKSRTVNSQERLEEGWSVTFVRDGDYLDLPYQETPAGAVRMALRALGEAP